MGSTKSGLKFEPLGSFRGTWPIHHVTVLPVLQCKLDLGTWQRMISAEFDGWRQTRVNVRVADVK
jgi:thiamine phosphate synthase YjbQ (UPF0047 family)